MEGFLDNLDRTNLNDLSKNLNDEQFSYIKHVVHLIFDLAEKRALKNKNTVFNVYEPIVFLRKILVESGKKFNDRQIENIFEKHSDAIGNNVSRVFDMSLEDSEYKKMVKDYHQIYKIISRINDIKK